MEELKSRFCPDCGKPHRPDAKVRKDGRCKECAKARRLANLTRVEIPVVNGAENDIRSSGKKRNFGSGIEPFVKMVKILRKNYLQTLEIFAKLFYNSIGGLYINI